MRRLVAASLLCLFPSAALHTLHAQWPASPAGGSTAGISFRPMTGMVDVTWQPYAAGATYHLFHATAQRCLAEVTMPGSTNITIRYWAPERLGQVNTPILKHIIFGTP